MDRDFMAVIFVNMLELELGQACFEHGYMESIELACDPRREDLHGTDRFHVEFPHLDPSVRKFFT